MIESKLNVASVIANRGGRDYAIYDPDVLTAEEQFLYTYKWQYNPNYSNNDNIIGQGGSDSSDNYTYTGGWFSKEAWEANSAHYVSNGKFIGDGSSKVWVVDSVSGTPADASEFQTVRETTLDSIGNAPYIYIPWSLEKTPVSPKKEGVLDALTDVRWVTSYVNAVYDDLKGQIRDAGGGATEMIEEEFLKRTVSYAAPVGKYFTSISQDNGILSTYTVADLPSDVLVADSIVTSYNAKYVKVTGHELDQNGSLYSGKDVLDENFQQVLTQNIQYDNTIYYVELSDTNNEFSTVTSENLAEINEKTIYVLDGNVYKPISIQDAVAGGGISTDFSTVASNTYFYANGTAANDKYLEGNSIHILADGSNEFKVNANITYVRNATASNTGLADAYDVRKTIEDMFTWIDLETNAPYGVAVAGA